RDNLRLLHFGMLFDAVWVSPHDRTADVAALVRRLEVSGVTVVRAREIAEDGLDGVLNRAFDITSLRERYDRFIAAYREQGERVTGPGISPAEALRVRTAVMTDWRAFPNLDPDLP